MFNNLGTQINTFLFGKKIGEDEFGNIYYINKNNKRWVVYYEQNDASSVSPEWQAWLTYTVNNIPKINEYKNKWQVKHQPNTTGINYIYNKSIKDKKSEKLSYNSWSPNKKDK
jgi:NADH:ubiquinone oxidoreductase subunit